jgi:hypothetical protein
MQRWLELSGRDAGTAAPIALPPQRGWLALGLPQLASETPLVLTRSHPDDPGRVLSVLVDRAGGLAVMRRIGGRLQRHHLPGPLPAPSGGLMAVIGWDLPQRRWTLAAEGAEGSRTSRSGDGDPVALSPAEARALCTLAGDGRTDPALGWYGLAEGRPPAQAAWIAAATPVLTPAGRVPAGRLRLGDAVLTADRGPRPVVDVLTAELPHCGTLAPVRLRAGHLAITRDIVVGPLCRIAFGGGDVEYMFGEEEVLVAAGDIGDGLIARRLRGGGTTRMVALVCEQPELILSDRLALLSGQSDGVSAAPRPCLRPFETAALLPERARSDQTPL